MANFKYFHKLYAQVIIKVLPTLKVNALLKQFALVASNSFWWNIIYKCVRKISSEGLSAFSTPMQNHITQAIT